MKRYCKSVNIEDKYFIQAAVMDCLNDKWERGDVHELLACYCKWSADDIAMFAKAHQRWRFASSIDRLCDDLREKIIQREISFPDVRHFTRVCELSRKTRELSIEDIRQQLYEYIAVYAMRELFDAKVGAHQYGPINGHGPLQGSKAIRKMLRSDPRGTRVIIQADVRKCYPSIPQKRLRAFLHRDIKNDGVLWLVFRLLDTMGDGLLIGSYLSQYLCTYYLSYAWHYASEQLAVTETKRDRRTKRTYQVRTRLVSHIVMYADDITITGSNKRFLLRGFTMLERYMRQVLGLHIKRSWQHYRMHYVDKYGKNRGGMLDTMGYKHWRDHAGIRRRIFLRARRRYARLEKRTRKKTTISAKLAGGAASGYGWFKHTDARRWLRKNVFRRHLMAEASKIIRACAHAKRRVTDDLRDRVNATYGDNRGATAA